MSLFTKKTAGLPSEERPWLKYYGRDAVKAAFPGCSVFDMMYEANKTHPGDIAINYFGNRISYGRLFDEIDKAAKAYTALGVKKGDTVIICAYNTPENIYSLYALDRLGAVLNPVDPQISADELREWINECHARVILTITPVYPLIREAVKGSCAEKILFVSPDEAMSESARFAYRLAGGTPELDSNTIRWADFLALGENTEAAYVPYEKDRCYVVAHADGTTGCRDWVMLSDDNFNAVTYSYRYIGVPFVRSQLFYNDIPPFVVCGVALTLHTALCFGLELLLYPVFDPRTFPELFAEYKPAYFLSGPDHLRNLISYPGVQDMDLSFLVIPGLGGGYLAAGEEERINEFLAGHGCCYKVVKGFGMTETASTAISTCAGANDIGSIGIPIITNSVKIADPETGAELGYGCTGEILISGPSIMLGYYNDPEATAKAIVTDGTGTRWLRTGNLGRINEDGLIYYSGPIAK